MQVSGNKDFAVTMPVSDHIKYNVQMFLQHSVTR